MLDMTSKWETICTLADSLINSAQYDHVLTLLGEKPADNEPEEINQLREVARRSMIGAYISRAVFCSRTKLLWVKGRFHSRNGKGTVELVCPSGEVLGQAHLGQRAIHWGDKYAGWVFEDVVDVVLNQGDVINARCTDASGAVVMVQGAVSVVSNGEVKARHELNVPASDQPSQTILLAIHNLDVEHRRDKLECFETIQSNLARMGWRLIALNHSPFPLVSPLQHVDFALDVPPLLQNTHSVLAGDEFETRLYEAVALRYGFEGELGLETTWDEARKAVIEDAERFEIYLCYFRPHLVLLWHQWNSFAHMNRFICERYEVPTIFAHEGFLPGTLGLDPLGEMAESIPAQNAETFRSLPLEDSDLVRARSLISHFKTTRADRKPQVVKGLIARLLRRQNEAGKTVIFYAGVNDWQTGMFPFWWARASMHSPNFVNTLDALTELLPIAHEQDFYILFKPHPNVQPPSNIPVSDRLLLVRDANIVECITETSITISLFSTANYIAMINDRPVVLLGRSSMSGAGVAYEMDDVRSLRSVIRQALVRDGWESRVESWERHVAALLRYYLFPYSPSTEERLLRTHRDTARFLLRHSGVGVWNRSQSISERRS
jgi:hypothetical protein